MNQKSKTAGARTRAAVRRSPSRIPQRGADLSALFNTATQALAANQSALNQADTENQNHGDNMVQTFNMITQALASQQGATPSKQLQYASKVLSRNANSGSAYAYSEGLAQAARQFKGQRAVSPDNVMTLIQALLGGGQQSAQQVGLGHMTGGGQAAHTSSQGQGGADLLTALLGGQGGQPAQSGQGADLLASLLGGQGGQPAQSGQGADLLASLLGGQAPSQGSQQGSGIDLGDVLNAGMAFMNAKQQGQDNLQAALTALMSAGPMAKPHRQQSGQLVANALLQAVAAMARPK